MTAKVSEAQAAAASVAGQLVVRCPCFRPQPCWRYPTQPACRENLIGRPGACSWTVEAWRPERLSQAPPPSPVSFVELQVAMKENEFLGKLIDQRIHDEARPLRRIQAALMQAPHFLAILNRTHLDTPAGTSTDSPRARCPCIISNTARTALRESR